MLTYSDEKDAINKGALVPFHYYGIYDDLVDYSALHILRGRYEEEELNRSYIGNVRKRNDLIYKNYKKYGLKKSLGFCSSRAHAEWKWLKNSLEENLVRWLFTVIQMVSTVDRTEAHKNYKWQR